MSYTPVELRHVKIGRRLFGYNRSMVEQMIEEVAESFEATWRERGELADHVERLEGHVAELRRHEELLTHTLVAAEQTASDIREHAKRSAEATLAEASNEAREITRAATAERDRLLVDAHQIAAMLRGALSMIETVPGAAESVVGSVDEVAEAPAVSAAEELEAPWPREDTREFEPIRLPPIADPEADVAAESEPTPFLRRLAGGNARDLDWSE